jgi:HAD superfamily phosphoserine phosphatase-like hydrolase
MIKAVVCDIDNTLTDNISWLKITESLGVSVQEHEEIFGKFLRNSISYNEAKQSLISLWNSSGKANKEYFYSLFKEWPLRPDALALAEYIRSGNYLFVLITGSVDMFAEAVAKKLHATAWYANTALEWNDNGVLTLTMRKIKQWLNFISFRILLNQISCH